jgi:hypothetical protein
MIVTKNENGTIAISDIVNGYRIQKVYIFFTVTEAKKAFKQYIKTI